MPVSEPGQGQGPPGGTSQMRRRRRGADRPKDTAAILSDLLLARVKITINGKQSSRAVLEAILLQLLQRALSGDTPATRLLLRYQNLMPPTLRPKFTVAFIDSAYTGSLANGLEVSSDD